MGQQVYNYRIYNNVYDEIISGRKTTEFRLLNEKSKKIKNGDLIKFSVVDDKNINVIVKVIDKLIYDDIEQLWKDKSVLGNDILNYTKEEFIEVFNNIFGKDSVINSKIVGIKFDLV